MNGRVYDYKVGRFLSVDPVIVDPTNSQAINPYSYVMNNPLGYTDPSGYTAETTEELDKTKVKVKRSGSRISTTVTATGSASNGTADIQLSGGTASAQAAVAGAIGGVAGSLGFSADIGSQGGVAKNDSGFTEVVGSSEAQGGTKAAISPNDVTIDANPETYTKVPARVSVGGIIGRALGTAIGLILYSPEIGNGEYQYSAEQEERLIRANEAGLAFAAEQIRNNNGKKTVVIGENQVGRVIPAAIKYNSLVIGAPRSQKVPGKIVPGSFNELVALTYNVAWIQGFKSAGYTFLDIGIDKSSIKRGTYYAAEKFTLGNYPKVQPIEWD